MPAATVRDRAQALAGATITAPFAGRVGTVDVNRGDQVAAGSTAVVVISTSVSKISASATVDHVSSLADGQTTRVTLPGSSRSLTGSVTAISRLPLSSSTTSGGTTSGVKRSTGTQGTVDVMSAGKAVQRTVTVGIVGITRTAITRGLTTGTRLWSGAGLGGTGTHDGAGGFGGPPGG